MVERGAYRRGALLVGLACTAASACGETNTVVAVVNQDSVDLEIGQMETDEDTTSILNFEVESLTLFVGDEAHLEAVGISVLDADTTAVAVAWYSTDPTVAAVTPEGRVVAHSVGETMIIASTGTASASIPVTVVDGKPPEPGAGDADQILADHVKSGTETGALVTGLHSDGTCWVDEHRTFVDVDFIDALDAECPDREGRVAVFSTERVVGVTNVVWQSAPPDVVDLTGLPEPFDVPVAAWLALDKAIYDGIEDDQPGIGGPDEAESFAIFVVEEQLGRADSLFREGRAGVGFSLLSGAVGIVDPADVSTVEGPAKLVPPGMCNALDDMVKSPTYYRSGALNVYYVGALGVDGAHCRYEGTDVLDRNEDVVYLEWSNVKDNTTLAHELGHALGLTFPHDGHVTSGYIEGFDEKNIMAPYSPIEGGRSTLTLGQAFRIATEPESWLNHATFLGSPVRDTMQFPLVRCPCDPYGDRVCPVLPSPGPVPAGVDVGNACFDLVRLLAMGGTVFSGLDPVGLVSGRLWRTGACVRHERTTAYGSTLHYLYHANMDRSDGCDVRLVVFTRHFGLAVTDQPGWRHGIDNPWTTNPTLALPPRLDLPMHVWRSTSVDAEPAWSVVENILCGGAGCPDATPATSRAGLRPQRTTHTELTQAEIDAVVQALGTALGCDPLSSGFGPGTFVPGAINIYFATKIPAMDPDGGISCRGASDNTALIAIPSGSTGTELAHHVGHVLGLPDSGDLLPSNMMHPAVSDARRDLTLGQIFRMHFHEGSWIGAAGIGPAGALGTIDCALPPDGPPEGESRCPALDEDGS